MLDIMKLDIPPDVSINFYRTSKIANVFVNDVIIDKKDPDYYKLIAKRRFIPGEIVFMSQIITTCEKCSIHKDRIDMVFFNWADVMLENRDITLFSDFFPRHIAIPEKDYKELMKRAIQCIDIENRSNLSKNKIDQSYLNKIIPIYLKLRHNYQVQPNGIIDVDDVGSFINHGCDYNISPTAITGEIMGYVALREINPGDELVRNYLGIKDIAKDVTTRKKILQENYNFDCKCQKCKDESEDMVRETFLTTKYPHLLSDLNFDTLVYSFHVPNLAEKNDNFEIRDSGHGHKSIIAKREFNTGEPIMNIKAVLSFRSNMKEDTIMIAFWTQLIYLHSSIKKRIESMEPKFDIFKNDEFKDMKYAAMMFYLYFKQKNIFHVAHSDMKLYIKTFVKLSLNVKILKTDREEFSTVTVMTNTCDPTFRFSCAANAECIIYENGSSLRASIPIQIGDEIYLFHNAKSCVCDNYAKRKQVTTALYGLPCECKYCKAGENDQIQDSMLSKNISFMFNKNLACAWCGNTKLRRKKCSGCLNVYYCGNECQKTHWDIFHKKVCDRKHKKRLMQ